jgi:uncharacterized protein
MRIALRVSANAKRSAVVGPYGDGWKVRVAAPAEGGRANAEIVRLLADVLALSPQQVRIVAGASSPNKVVEIDGLAPGSVSRRLMSAR